ncbi:MAG: pknB 27 [Gemmataceae bacterium]|nr:pknB 27 [Gemmataceae bacterium]
MPVLTPESVLADLRRFPFLTPEQLVRVEAASRKGTHTPERIVRKLAGAGWLTHFQAEMLLAGRADGLAFGPYLLLDKLGSGGMGVVYKARHVRLGRVDALKVIRADKIASKLIARRFLREIQLTSSLEHPHIVRALDAGHVGRQLYLATEFIPGEDLATIVRRSGPLTVADACLVAYQTSLALQHIHDRGLVHRDLKPSNLMRDEVTRAAKLLDLGLSGFRERADATASQGGTLTSDGMMLGTPDFMAPEQVRNPHGVDIRADLYALGCTLFYLLTGRTPFDGTAIEKLTQHISSPPPPLFLPNGPAPPALAAIVGRLMAKGPEDRYPTPQALTTALLALRPGHIQPPAEGPPGDSSGTARETPAVDEWQSQFGQLIAQDESSPSPAPEKTPVPKPGRGARARVAWAAMAVLIGAGLLVALLARSGRPPETTNTPPPAPPAPEDLAAEDLRALRKAVATQADNRDQLRQRVLEYRARHPGTAYAASAAALLRRLPSPLDRLPQTTDPETEIPSVRVGELGSPITWLGFGPADDRLFVTRRGGTPEEWDLPALTATGRFREPPADRDVIVSLPPDGRGGVAVEAGKLSIWGEDGRVRVADTGPPLAARVAGIAPDGRSAVVAFASPEEPLARVDLETGKILTRFEYRSARVKSITVSANGGACLVLGSDGLFRVVPLAAGKAVWAFDRQPIMAGTPSGVFGPDGQRLYLTGVGRTAARFAHESQTPDVRYEVEAESPPGGVSRWRGPSAGRPTCIAVSADEATVAVGTRVGNLYVYAAATGKPIQQFRLFGRVDALAFSAHGKILAVATEDGAVVLIPLKS